MGGWDGVGWGVVWCVGDASAFEYGLLNCLDGGNRVRNSTGLWVCVVHTDLNKCALQECETVLVKEMESEERHGVTVLCCTHGHKCVLHL